MDNDNDDIDNDSIEDDGDCERSVNSVKMGGGGGGKGGAVIASNGPLIKFLSCVANISVFSGCVTLKREKFRQLMPLTLLFRIQRIILIFMGC